MELPCPAMEDDEVAGEAGEPRLPWIERERMAALQRFATSRARLAELEDMTSGSALLLANATADDLATIDEMYKEIDSLRHKAAGRFGGKAAERIEELELQARLVLERIGFGSYEALQAERAKPPTITAVDPTMLAFAKREYADAEKAFFEVAALDIPEAVADDEDDDGPGADVVDLHAPRPAAS